MLRSLTIAATLALLAGTAAADTAFSISEVFVNPPSGDNGFEGFEIRGPASTALTGYRLLEIDGDGTNSGNLNNNFDLGSFSTGANAACYGLFLWRDAATVLVPAPEGATVVNVANFVDLQNGSTTWVLGIGVAPVAGGPVIDLDSDNDGTLNVGALAGFVVVDAVTILENDGGVNNAYADDFGFANAVFGPFSGSATIGSHQPDALVRIYSACGPCGWAGGDVLGTNPGPYTMDYVASPPRAFGWDGFGILTAQDVSLGSTNPAGVDNDGDGLLDACDGCPNDITKSAPQSCGCGVAEGCTMGIDIDTISVVPGGTQTLSLHGGLLRSNYGYIILGSVTGTSPGFDVNANVHMDLNPDYYFFFLAQNPNTLLNPSLGTLDALGEGVAYWSLPPGVADVGGSPVAVTHQALFYNPANGANKSVSNTTPLIVTP